MAPAGAGGGAVRVAVELLGKRHFGDRRDGGPVAAGLHRSLPAGVPGGTTPGMALALRDGLRAEHGEQLDHGRLLPDSVGRAYLVSRTRRVPRHPLFAAVESLGIGRGKLLPAAAGALFSAGRFLGRVESRTYGI